VNLALVSNDLRHVFHLCVSAEYGTKSENSEERKVALHQLMFGTRLVYSILYEGWKVIERGWHATAMSKKWHPKLTEEARAGLSTLGKYFAKDNLCRTVRDHFGFHYLPDYLRPPLNMQST